VSSLSSFSLGTEFPMRQTWLFAIIIASLCLLLYAAVFVLFMR
jgi:hypothetical protein